VLAGKELEGISMESHVKMVGPVVRGLDPNLAEAVISAIEVDNPDAEVMVDDQGGYIRIATPNECRMTRASLEDALGRTFKMHQLEPQLAGFAGRMKLTDDEVVWYLERQD
jgi:toluene monooxygenase system protein D